MKIGINTLNVHKLSQGRGIGFYTENLYKELEKVLGDDLVLVEKESQLESCELVHFPTFDFFQKTLKLTNKNNVVTVHDVIPLMYPKYYPPGIKGKINLFFQKKQLKKVDAIITDSKSSKKEIQKHLQIPEEKIHVIYLAPADYFREISDKKILNSLKDKYKLPERFVLFTGNVNWNKNILNMAQGVIAAKIDLVLVGSSFAKTDNLDHPELRSYKKFREVYKDNPLIHTLGFIPNEDLVGILNMAEVLLLPSFAEGFGLPILEAQTCGVPVITSNDSSMKEIAGSSAYLINPENPEEITEALETLISNSSKREEIIKKGLENAKQYSWAKTAQETVKVYKQVLNQ
jgi:glycosyltransferase involved in cell wall biosynthesis